MKFAVLYLRNRLADIVRRLSEIVRTLSGDCGEEQQNEV